MSLSYIIYVVPLNQSSTLRVWVNTGENPITRTKKRRPGFNSKGRVTEEPELAGKLTRIQLKLLGDPLTCVSLPTIVGYTPLASCSLYGTRGSVKERYQIYVSSGCVYARGAGDGMSAVWSSIQLLKKSLQCFCDGTK